MMMELFKILLLWQLLPAVNRCCQLQQLEDQLQHHRQQQQQLLQQQHQHQHQLQQPTVLSGLWSWLSLNRQLWS